MQLKVKIKLEQELTLPISYNSIIQGIIYHSATKIDKNFTSNLHDKGLGIETEIANFKYFTFSKILGKYEIRDKNITFYDEIRFEIRSIDPYFIHLVYEGMNKYGINFGEVNVRPELKLENKIITSNSINIKMLSPIIAVKKDDDNKKEFLNPMTNEFIPYLKNNYLYKYQNYYNNEGNDINIDIINVTYRDKCVTSFKKIMMTGWYGVYHLEGSPESLTFLYNTGLGGKNSQGFGLFKIIDED